MNVSSSRNSVPAATRFPSEEASQQRTPLETSSVFVTITSLITQANSLEFSYTYTWSLENQICRPKRWLIHPSQTTKVRHSENQPDPQLHEWTLLRYHVQEEFVFGEGISYLVGQFCGMEKRPRQHRQRASSQETTHKRLHGLKKRKHGDRVPHTETRIPALHFSRYLGNWDLYITWQSWLMISVSSFSLLDNRYRLSIPSSPTYSLLRLLIHTHYYLLLSIIRTALNFIITVLSSTLFASASESQTPLSVVIFRVQALTMPRQGTSRPDQRNDSLACSSCRALVDLGHVYSCQLIQKNFHRTTPSSPPAKARLHPHTCSSWCIFSHSLCLMRAHRWSIYHADFSLLTSTEKSPLPAIIVTPSSPVHKQDFSIAFLAPEPKPTFRKRVVTYVNHIADNSGLTPSRSLRTFLILAFIFFVMITTHLIILRFSAYHYIRIDPDSRSLAIDPTSHGRAGGPQVDVWHWIGFEFKKAWSLGGGVAIEDSLVIGDSTSG